MLMLTSCSGVLGGHVGGGAEGWSYLLWCGWGSVGGSVGPWEDSYLLLWRFVGRGGGGENG